MVFSSVYEMTNPLNIVKKQHMWEYFSGKAISARRWKTTLVGSATISIADEINSGVKFSTTGASQKATMSSGGANPSARQFYHQNCTFIASFKFDATQASTIQSIGLSNGTLGSPLTYDYGTASISDKVNQAVLHVDHGDGSGAVISTATTTATDTNWHTVEISLDSNSYITTKIDGNAIGSTITSVVPTHRVAPIAHIESDVTKNMYINYMEVFNT
jgi:hypothetical protein